MKSIMEKAHEQNNLIEIQPRCLNKILEEKPNSREFLLYPWLPRAGLGMVYAASGVGKTFFALNVGYAVASGGNFLKFSAPKPSRVLYVDGEMTYPVMQPRIEMIAKAQGLMHDPSNFQLLTCDQFPNGNMPKLSTLEGQCFINNLIEKYNIELVIIDNISTTTNLIENNAEDWNVMQDWEIFLKTRGVGMLLIHHTGKNDKIQRGTEKRKDILDTCILLETVETGEIIIANQFKISFDKSRGCYGKESESFEASLDIQGQWHMKSNEQSTMDKVIEFSNLGMSRSEISIELGIHRSNVGRAYNKAKELGLIKFEAHKKDIPRKYGWIPPARDD